MKFLPSLLALTMTVFAIHGAPLQEIVRLNSAMEAEPSESNTQPEFTEIENVTTQAPSDDIPAKDPSNDQPGSDPDAEPADQPDENAPEEDPTAGNQTNGEDPCKEGCTPTIDINASVIEAYKRHRAQVAVIGDYGNCKAAASSKSRYSWTIDWGDEKYDVKQLESIGPYQSEHIYAKKGKYSIEVTFCNHLEGCETGCTTLSKKLPVKP